MCNLLVFTLSTVCQGGIPRLHVSMKLLLYTESKFLECDDVLSKCPEWMFNLIVITAIAYNTALCATLVYVVWHTNNIAGITIGWPYVYIVCSACVIPPGMCIVSLYQISTHAWEEFWT